MNGGTNLPTALIAYGKRSITMPEKNVIVEDDIRIRTEITHLLQQERYNTEDTCDSVEAANLLESTFLLQSASCCHTELRPNIGQVLPNQLNCFTSPGTVMERLP
jgi:hypothetical protein